MRESTKEHWRTYWKVHSDADELYSNEGRVVDSIARACPLKDSTVLEVGAGSGRDSVALVGMGARVVVLDYVEDSLTVVRREAAKSGVELLLVCGEATRMPFREGSFDVVFHQGLLEHFRDPGPLLEENRRVTAKGGVLLVDVPQKYHVYTLVKHVLIPMGKWFAGWETEYSVADLERLVRSHGFSIKFSYGDWMVPGFFYRSLRYGLRKVGVSIPKYPRGVPPFSSWAERFRRWFRTKRAAFYTFAVVGTVATKD
ncbi:MAG: class I SAM-dependent methyltransferase [Candidatus Eisenbacteria bacterium]|nr:class I SAM-dependent methyltransferase [Candidatus Eisenbacteria bacterium]